MLYTLLSQIAAGASKKVSFFFIFLGSALREHCRGGYINGTHKNSSEMSKSSGDGMNITAWKERKSSQLVETCHRKVRHLLLSGSLL